MYQYQEAEYSKIERHNEVGAEINKIEKGHLINKPDSDKNHSKEKEMQEGKVVI